MSSLIISLTIVLATAAVLFEWRRRRREELRLRLVALFAPSLARVQDNPQELVAWSRVASQARALFPDEFKELDLIQGEQFPFSKAIIEDAGARWATRWLAWERAHDAEYKQKAEEIQAELKHAEEQEIGKCEQRLQLIEQEKLLTYQERYEEYVRVSRSLGALQ
jgi:hypothetical protein